MSTFLDTTSPADIMEHVGTIRKDASMKKTAIYLRRSSRTQETTCQRSEIEKYLNDNVVAGEVAWYADEAVTGSKLNRPALRRLQRDIVDGTVDTVICWKLDRLSRNICDGVKLLTDWTTRNVRVIAVTQRLDLSGPLGRMVASLLLGIAEMEREHLRERQAAGIATARARGTKFGRPKAVDTTAIRNMKSTGLSVKQIADYLSISRQSVYNALRFEAA